MPPRTISPEAELWEERRNNARRWAQAATDAEMNVAVTLTPGHYVSRLSDAEPFIDSVCRKAFQDLNRELFGLSRKEATQETKLAFLGIYELHDWRGSFFPHAHLAMRLSQKQRARTEFFLRCRWGAKDKDPSTKKYIYTPAYHRPFIKNKDAQPEFYLTDITGMSGWMTYISKQTNANSNLVLPDQFIKRHAHTPRKTA